MVKSFKKIASVLAAATVLLSVIPATSFAHEVFYNPATSSTVAVRWQNLSVDGHMSKLDANGDYLSSPYTDNFSTAVSNWMSSSSAVVAYAVSFSTSKVDLSTPTQSSWDNSGIPYYAAAATIMYDKAGAQVMTYTQAYNSTKKMNYANVWCNPNKDYAGPSETDQSKTLTHEMGHVLGLGHPEAYNPIPTSTTSVMRQGSLGYSTPQSHEASDIRAMYGF
ncbi:hypothetical protein [Paenibacillus gansuensis]|uniref:Peptidase M10 metallopeptidase domain-containing protein n=1 Tax=Paenibacillus gansuensis TaxID=306542 RepID=A0ABW5PKJ5_9BACL